MANNPPKDDKTFSALQDLRIEALEKEVSRLKAYIQRDLEVERNYLWTQLAAIEAFAKTAPDYGGMSSLRLQLKAALDGFNPTVKTDRVMP